MDKMSIAVSQWFARRIEGVMENASKSKNREVFRFCRKEVLPIYLEAVKQTYGGMRVKTFSFEVFFEAAEVNDELFRTAVAE